MPETQLPHERELDERIRRLVALAVADAPAPPDLRRAAAAATLDRPEPRAPRTPWGIVGLGAAAVAATVIGLLVLSSEDRSVRTPAGPSTVEPNPTSTAPSTVAPSTTATHAPAIGATPVFVTVTGASVAVASAPGAAPTATFDQPAAIALGTGDGRVVGQAVSGNAATDTTPADTHLWLWSPQTGAQPFQPGGAELDGRFLTLHDVAAVDGRTLVLYSAAGSAASPDATGDEVLYAADLEDPSVVANLGVIGGWEDGTQRLHLAQDGLVVGTWFSGASTGLFVSAVPGSPAEPIAAALTPAALGLEDAYVDCADCPTVFTVDDAGTTLAWLRGTALVRVPLAAGAPGAPLEVPFASLRSNVVDLDLIGGAGAYIVTYGSRAGQPADPRTLLVTGDAAGVDLGVDVATWGPGSPPSREPAATATTTPTATSSVDASGPPLVPAGTTAVVTAGPAGITTGDLGATATETGLGPPAALALVAGDVVVFQTDRGGDPADPAAVARSQPQLLDAGGAVRPWPVVAAYDGAPATWRLHDVTEFQGTTWVVYSLVTLGDVIFPGGGPGGSDVREPIDTLYAAPLAGGEPVDLGRLGAWESGSPRVQAASTGLLVGPYFDDVTQRLWTATLPGAAVPAITPAELGLEDAYSECATCPRGFGITPDGSTVTWLADGVVVFHRIDSGNEQRIPLDGAAGEAGTVGWVEGALVGDGLVAVVQFESDPAPGHALLVTATPGRSVEQRPLPTAAATLTP